jgi:dTDP-4-amino-4,6-dideoxygalactose transaminase
MAALLLDVQPGDEVIMPSYTFVSTANAFVLRGARVVFVDIRADTLNMDENLIEKAISDKTRAVVPVHYAGVACEMDTIMEIAGEYNLFVVEDAAQGVNSTYKGRYLGTLGHLGAYSFHETKNFISGEGGALLINDKNFVEQAEIIREKGTDRAKFFRGEVDKYTWVRSGSSFLPSELVAAFLYAQLEDSETITRKRSAIFAHYMRQLAPLQERGFLKLPVAPSCCTHNAHMFYIVLQDMNTRNALIDYMKDKGISVVFHYIPLHMSPMGRKMGYEKGDLPVTEKVSECLLRLPCYFELTSQEQDRVIECIYDFASSV